MKRIIQIAAALALATCLFSCHKEIVIPDPGFDMSETVLDTILRDTTSVYRVAFNVKAPNGVRFIQLLNGRNFEVLQEFDEYVGQTNFEFKHEFDFSSCDPERDSIFVYNVKIRTNDNRGYNKSIRVQQLRKSHPEITGPSSNTMNIFGRAFVFDGTITTGYYPIESIKVTLNGEQLMNVGAAELDGASTYRLYHKITRDFEKGKQYTYAVTVKDQRGEEKTFSYNLVGAILKKPVAIKYTSGSSNKSTRLYYNEQGLLERFYDPYGGYITALSYDENGRLVMVIRDSSNCLGDPNNQYGQYYGYGLYIWYQYNEDGSLRRFGDGGYSTTVGSVDHKMLDPWWVEHKDEIVPESMVISDLKGTELEGFIRSASGWNDPALNKYKEFNGKRYITDMTGTSTNHIGPFEYLEDFEDGKLLYTGIIGSSHQGVHPFYSGNIERFAQFMSYVPVLNPLYVEDFPMMLHWRYQGVWAQLLGCKYAPSSVIRPNGTSTASMTTIYPVPYSVREDGLLKSMGGQGAGIPGSSANLWTFYYDDEPQDGWIDYLNAAKEALLEREELFR